MTRLIFGARISLMVGVGSAVLACIFGSCLGLFAGYVGGWVEGLIMRIVDLFLSFPAILVALMILAFLGNGVMNVVLAIIVVEWAYYSRAVRGTASGVVKRVGAAGGGPGAADHPGGGARGGSAVP